MKLSNFGMTILVLCCICVVPATNAETIVYEATDLTDLVPGEDLWKYTYTVSGYTFNSESLFGTYFDGALSSNLKDPTPNNSAWKSLVLPGDDADPTSIYSAFSLIDAPSLEDPFMVSFIWTGTGSPGPQEYFVVDSAGIFAEGTTQSSVPPVPVPSSVILMISGLIGIAGFKKKYSSHQ